MLARGRLVAITLGIMGAGDRVLLHRVAGATLGDVLERVGQAIRHHTGRDQATRPATARGPAATRVDTLAGCA